MKRVLFAASFIALSSSASFALEPGCNHAVQNWQNGSQDTCPSPTPATSSTRTPPEVHGAPV